jgi:uncharacterized protein (DUF1501 family)
MLRDKLSRRDWLKLSSAGVIGCSMSGWFEALANDAVKNPERKRSCILLWMAGGPSQTDTFDLKPGHANGGPYKEIATSVPGIKIGEHLPKVAQHADKMAIIRTMSTKEMDHNRATFFLRTGYQPLGPVQYPPLGSLVANELGDQSAALPSFISIAPYTFLSPAAFGSGFLGPQYAPLIVGTGGFRQPNSYEQALKVQDLVRPTGVKENQADARVDLLQRMQKDFSDRHPGIMAESHQSAYDRAVRLMKTAAAKAFDLSEEKDALRDAYGRNLFGQGCLLARRLVERGVSFVEVTLNEIPGVQGGWDTHLQNFDQVRKLCEVLDPAWSTLMTDLKERGLLDTTLVVWMGEFGRTPKINNDRGRDHFAEAWSTVLAGGGIKGGQVVGKTSPDGGKVVENLVTVPNFMATVVKALGIDHTKQNMSNVGRPIRIADAGSKPIAEVVA